MFVYDRSRDLHSSQSHQSTESKLLPHREVKLPQCSNRKNIYQYFGENMNTSVGKIEHVDINAMTWLTWIPENRYRNTLKTSGKNTSYPKAGGDKDHDICEESKSWIGR